jgi:hypothetical protein
MSQAMSIHFCASSLDMRPAIRAERTLSLSKHLIDFVSVLSLAFALGFERDSQWMVGASEIHRDRWDRRSRSTETADGTSEIHSLGDPQRANGTSGDPQTKTVESHRDGPTSTETVRGRTSKATEPTTPRAPQRTADDSSEIHRTEENFESHRASQVDLKSTQRRPCSTHEDDRVDN